jgi:RNA polymerase sigma factor (sigma-70 family)
MRDDPTVVAIVTSARGGDKAAWDELVERYAPLVWSICRRYGLSRPDADDVGGSVWLRLIEHLPDLREPAALPGWLVTTTRRECMRVLRINQRQQRLEDAVDPEETADTALTVDEEVLVEERNLALRLAFGQLPEACRNLLAMLVQDPPVPYGEISARLRMPVGSIGPNRQRCLARLRRCPLLAAFVNGGDPDDGGGGTGGHAMGNR